jgi:hypothetical protein
MVAILFVVTTVVMAVLVPAGVWWALREEGAPDAGRRAATLGGAIAAWLVFTLIVALSGAVEPTGGPPRVMAIILPALAGAVLFARSGLGEIVARRLPMAWIVGMQAFRVPVELVLFGLAGLGVAPVQMTFEGRNFDIVTGSTALLLGLALAAGRAPRALVVAWNLMGLGLLVNIVTVAVLMVPGPLRSIDGAPNLVPTTAPYVWLPVYLVPLALLGHLLVFRKLRALAPGLAMAEARM